MVSLISFAFMATVTIAAFAYLAESVALAPRHAVLRSLAATLVIIVAVVIWFRVADPIRAHFPPSFFLWGATPFLALALVLFTWRRSVWLLRVQRVLTVPVCLTFAAATINVHYQYYPSLQSLHGWTAHDKVTVLQAVRIEEVARTTNTLPDRGVVLSENVDTPRSRFKARAPFVYLPPAWFGNPRPALPVVMLISGSPGTPADWTRSANADRLFDYWAAYHGGNAPVLVMPDVNGGPLDDTECVDGPRGRAETYITEDLRSYVIDKYGVRSDPGGWAISGLSEGGTCAMTLVLRHPDLFGSFAEFGGQAQPTVGRNDLRDLFGGNVAEQRAHDPANIMRGLRRPELAGWFEVGSGDYGATAAAKKLAPMVANAGGRSCIVLRGGIHNFTFWSDSLKHAQPWLIGQVFGVPGDGWATACTRAGGRVVRPGDVIK